MAESRSIIYSSKADESFTLLLLAVKDLNISTSSFAYLEDGLIADKKVQMFDNYQKGFYELYKLDKPYPVLSQLLLVISVLPERYC